MGRSLMSSPVQNPRLIKPGGAIDPDSAKPDQHGRADAGNNRDVSRIRAGEFSGATGHSQERAHDSCPEVVSARSQPENDKRELRRGFASKPFLHALIKFGGMSAEILRSFRDLDAALPAILGLNGRHAVADAFPGKIGAALKTDRISD